VSKKPKIIRPFIVTKDPMVQSLLHKFAKRSEDGILKYKKTMAQANKPIEKWIEDAQEEAWDQIVYLEKLKSLLTKVH
jgi:hypothetical protein|tara:strand:- start:5938 stop:6171 length:234 start_codon:yes stop_codon:yes gene_type:complete